MQIGFFTAALPDQPIERIAHWAAEDGFSAIEVDVRHHLANLTHPASGLERVRAEGVEICALTVTGNQMAADPAERTRARSTLRAAIDAAAACGIELVVAFPGRDETISEDENYLRLADYLAPLADHAGRGNVGIIFENWPGPCKDYLATTPAGWARLFELAPAPNLGLNFDPSHLVWQGIDHERAFQAVADRVFLVHAKDTEIFPERLQQTGYFGRGWWRYRLPGHGTIDWERWLGLVRKAGFDETVSIEHEDVEWGWGPAGTAEQRREGLREGLRVLRSALFGVV